MSEIEWGKQNLRIKAVLVWRFIGAPSHPAVMIYQVAPQCVSKVALASLV
jgi:hypothetical protein